MENASLHPKPIIFDDDTVFIGSMNLDPRSLYLNMELDVVLRSRELAIALRSVFRVLTQSENAWKVSNPEDGLRWTSSAGTLDREPARCDWQRLQEQLSLMRPVSDQM